MHIMPHISWHDVLFCIITVFVNPFIFYSYFMTNKTVHPTRGHTVISYHAGYLFHHNFMGTSAVVAFTTHKVYAISNIKACSIARIIYACYCYTLHVVECNHSYITVYIQCAIGYIYITISVILNTLYCVQLVEVDSV